MRGLRRYTRFALMTVGVLSTCGTVSASGLQVSPVSLSLQALRNADGLWLSNTATNIVHAQVRVYHWTQPSGDQLVPSRNLLVSPPMLQVDPGDRQLIRVIRTGLPPNGADAVEDAYRVLVDELPIENKGKTGLQFVLHYSIPVFVEPAGTASASPQLQWILQRDGDKAILQVINNGNGHAQLSRVSYVDRAGHRIEINKGLMGYVLPKSTMRWAMNQPASEFTDEGDFEAAINGVETTQKVPLVDLAH
jgi:fimbrial chaperone protein